MSNIGFTPYAPYVAPWTLRNGFVGDLRSKIVFEHLWHELPWEKRDDSPRRECWMNDFDRPYTYGKGAGERTYFSNIWHPVALDIRNRLLEETGVLYQGCFINGYENERNHLGWHQDDGPDIDQGCPIAVVSFGAEREIWFREKTDMNLIPGRALLKSGSLFLMHAGFQLTHEHRIPKHSAACGPRISLTFRALKS